MSQLEVLDELLVRRGFLQRIELLPLHVLDDRLLQHRGVVRRAHDRGDRLEPDAPGRAPAPPARDQLEAVTTRPDEDRLEHADFPDRFRQRGKRLLVEVLARLLRIRPDRRGRYLLEPELVVRDDAGRDQCTETSTQPAGTCHGSPPWPTRDTRSHREMTDRTR